MTKDTEQALRVLYMRVEDAERDIGQVFLALKTEIVAMLPPKKATPIITDWDKWADENFVSRKKRSGKAA